MGGNFHRYRAQDSEEEKTVILTLEIYLILPGEFRYHS